MSFGELKPFVLLGRCQTLVAADVSAASSGGIASDVDARLDLDTGCPLVPGTQSPGLLPRDLASFGDALRNHDLGQSTHHRPHLSFRAVSGLVFLVVVSDQPSNCSHTYPQLFRDLMLGHSAFYHANCMVAGRKTLLPNNFEYCVRASETSLRV